MNLSNKTIFTVSIAILIMFCNQGLASIDSTSDAVSYTVSIDESNHNLAKVTATFTLQDKFLYMFSGANNFPKRWAKFVSHMKAKDHTGKPIEITELEGAKWSLEVVTNKPITISYQLNLEHEKYRWSGGVDGAAYARERGVFYTGRSIFIVNGKNRNNINVSFNLPPKWRVTTPWLVDQNDSKSYKVNNFTELSTSMFFAGLHKEISIKRGDFELVLALSSSHLIAQKDEYINLAKGVFDYYTNLMGGVPKLSPDNNQKKSVVIISSGDSTDGEAIGNNISILIEENGDQMSKAISRFIFAHEFFHLWNGKSFTPQNDNSEWFKEGFSNYYTLKSLHHIGFLNDESFLSMLTDFFYQKYDSDDGTGKLTMTNGELKHDHWGLIYAGGLLVAISQDMIIREATSNKSSLDDLMRTLFSRYGGTDQRYTLNELKTELSMLSGSDQSEFFDSYIIGINKLPLGDYLRKAGLNFSNKNGRFILVPMQKMTPLQQKLRSGLFGLVLP